MWDFLHSVRPVWEQSWVIKRGNCLTNAVNVETLSLCQIYLNRLEQLDVFLLFQTCECWRNEASAGNCSHSTFLM